MKIKFSVIQYHLLSRERMNIGILFFNEETNERCIKMIKKWSRLKSFDDEVDTQMVKLILDGINDEIQDNIFNGVFNIEKYRRLYINEIRFGKVCESITENFNQGIEDIQKHFLRQDYEKNQRPPKEEQIKFMKGLLKDNLIDYKVKPIIGEYGESIKFDYIIENYAFKIFHFENSNIKRLIKEAKICGIDSLELNNKYNIIVLFDIKVRKIEFNIIMDILNKYNVTVMEYQEGIDFMLSLKRAMLI